VIWKFLHRHLPGWMVPIVCSGVYAALIVMVWLRWDDTGADFRYVGL
jgi:hypothetical protein